MRFIHTADWHLGQTLHGQNRATEQQAALDWLYTLAEAEALDGIIVSGDIFDVASPSEEARKLYYDFLARLSDLKLKFVLILAGNHDSPRMLSNVDAFAKRAGIHIITKPASEAEIAQDLIVVKHPADGSVMGVIAAIPFLQSRFIRKSYPGESSEDKEQALASGIHHHFDQLGRAADAYPEVPCVATGHLYASGAQARAGQDNIYVGNMRNLRAADLPSRYDYVALGHIHRAQALKDCEHVRYSGSLVALDFQEGLDEKGCYVVDVQAGECPAVTWHAYPANRRLKQLLGTVAEVKEKLTAFCERHKEDAFSPWIELILSDGVVSEASRAELRAIAIDRNCQVLKITKRRSNPNQPIEEMDIEKLDDIRVEDVYERRCTTLEIDESTRKRIDPLFTTALADARTGNVNYEA